MGGPELSGQTTAATTVSKYSDWQLVSSPPTFSAPYYGSHRGNMTAGRGFPSVSPETQEKAPL